MITREKMAEVMHEALMDRDNLFELLKACVGAHQDRQAKLRLELKEVGKKLDDMTTLYHCSRDAVKFHRDMLQATSESYAAERKKLVTCLVVMGIVTWLSCGMALALLFGGMR